MKAWKRNKREGDLCLLSIARNTTDAQSAKKASRVRVLLEDSERAFDALRKRSAARTFELCFFSFFIYLFFFVKLLLLKALFLFIEACPPPPSGWFISPPRGFYRHRSFRIMDRIILAWVTTEPDTNASFWRERGRCGRNNYLFDWLRINRSIFYQNCIIINIYLIRMNVYLIWMDICFHWIYVC